MNARRRFQFFSLIGMMIMALLGLGIGSATLPVHAAPRADAYDLSEWQGRLNNRQTRHLGNEVSFLILRAQNGSRRQDLVFHHNVKQLSRYQIPYGVYSYSLYRNVPTAREEALSLYQRAPQAQFYVNDDEVNHAGRRSNRDAEAWAREMKHLTTRPVVLYSYASFIQRHLNRAKNHYNVIWLANYNRKQPITNFKYGMWQFSDNYYSRALGKRIDASRLTGTPLAFWINANGRSVGTTSANSGVRRQRQVNVRTVQRRLRTHHHHVLKRHRHHRRARV